MALEVIVDATFPVIVGRNYREAGGRAERIAGGEPLDSKNNVYVTLDTNVLLSHRGYLILI